MVLPGFLDIRAWGFFPGAPEWTSKDIPDQTGKVAIVTGANTGIGLETAYRLAEKGAKVHLACRSKDKADKAIEYINTKVPNAQVQFLQLDLSSLRSSLDAGRRFASTEPRLDLLINNAGVMMPPEGSLTQDGYDLQWGTNNLGHQAFTQALVPLLKKTAKSASAGSVRIIWVASSGHWILAPWSGVDFESLKEGKHRKRDTNAHYGISKLGNVHQAAVQARQLKSDGIITASLHPGNIFSDLQRHQPWIVKAITSIALHSTERGALTSLYTATSPDVTLAESGSYYVPWARKWNTSHAKADDPAAQEATWEWNEKEIAAFESKAR
ncbi:NAD(P)-binding protein [Ceraceosorus guamensis]|uniref:NAD(P)-binding protein n=1 Tax=Ceraceosorus guamensis TaxID=1522189 RepID=A0A316W0S0_9BASI|nr:NAD(P)-binding protein [Ceraceosorus guamensis]PWN43390.1 NAD(P)-binding protein [Ceraceosorus guamensis]